MRIDWIKQSGSGVLLVFFNGWGMDVRAIPHLSTKYDLVVCSDYRSLGTEGDNICFRLIIQYMSLRGRWACGQQPICYRGGRCNRQNQSL